MLFFLSHTRNECGINFVGLKPKDDTYQHTAFEQVKLSYPNSTNTNALSSSQLESLFFLEPMTL